MTEVNTGRRRIMLRPGRGDLTDAAFLAVLTLLALVGFRTTFDGSTYLIVGVAGLLIGLLVGHLAVILRQPWIVVAAVSIVMFFLLGGAIALRAQAAGGFLPTPGTLNGLLAVGVHGWKQLLTTLPPLDADGPLIAIPYLLGLAGGSGGYTIARRVRASAAPLVVPALLLAAVILLGTQRPAAQFLQGTAFALVALCWAAVRRARSRPPVRNGSGQRSRLVAAGVILALTAAGSWLAGPHLSGHSGRTVLRSYVVPPFDIAKYPSPLVGYRKYTKDAKILYASTLFTVVGVPAGTPIKIATLDGYDGTVWGATNSGATPAPSAPADTFQRVGSRIDATAHGIARRATITIAPAYAATPDLASWVPGLGSATHLTFSGSDAVAHAQGVRYDLATGSAIVPGGLSAGDIVQVTANAPPRATSRMQPDGSPTLDPSAYTVVDAKVRQWTAQAPDAWGQLNAVAATLKRGAYSDGGPNESQYLPGHGDGRLANFLGGTQLVGDEEQYAATFALMANDLGTPARVVFGAITGADGVVTGADIHAWVEVYAGGNWVYVPYSVFTPDRSKHPNKQQPQTVQNSNASVVPPPNPVRPPSTQGDAAAADSSSLHTTSKPPAPHQAAGFHLPAWVVTTTTWGGPPIGLLVALGLLIVLAKAVRRYRRRTTGSAAARFSHGWRELVDHARDHGVAVPVGRTRREEGALPGLQMVAIMAEQADEYVFGPAAPADQDAERYWAEIRRARREVSARYGRWRRLRAAVSLRSFRRRPVAT